ncbi:MAG: hypothetical protein O9283_04100 [Sphingomonadaceae bacterium]|nr:hypothetical protein [Sphingomonadaceae bacterium]
MTTSVVCNAMRSMAKPTRLQAGAGYGERCGDPLYGQNADQHAVDEIA